jgi:hypothetical protein
MELAEQARPWIEDIDHCVSFDSWDQFLNYGQGLRSMWGHLSLLSWSCREDRGYFEFQLVYMDLKGIKTKNERLPVFKQHRFELKCVLIRIKDQDIPVIKTWLVENNPDLWAMNYLTKID